MSSQTTQSATPSVPSSSSSSSIMTTTSNVTSFKHQDGNVEHRHGHFSMQLLLSYMKTATDYASKHVDIDTVIRERDQAMRKNEVRKRQLSEKNKEIADLQTTRKVTLTDYENRFEKWRAEKQELMEKFREEKEKILGDHAAEMAQLETQMKQWKGQSATLVKEVDVAKRDAQLTRSELAITTQKLEQWELFTTHVKVLDQAHVVSTIDDLFKGLYRTIHSQFFADLPSAILTNHEAWSDGLKQLDLRDVQLKVPLSNSRVARLLRVALAMHVVSDELTTRVFIPYYIPDSLGLSVTLQQTMRSLFQAEPKKRLLMRALLVTAKPREELAEVIQKRSLAAREAVVHKLSFMCSGDGGIDLRSRLEHTFTEAATLWEEIQYSEDEVLTVACDDSEPPDWDWPYAEELGEPLEGPSSASKKLLLFPGFYLPDEDSILYEGYALYADQKHVVDAEKECRTMQATRVRQPGGLSPTKRRLSLCFGKASSSPPVSPTSTSPRTLKSVDANGPGGPGIGLGLGIKSADIGHQNGTALSHSMDAVESKRTGLFG